MTIVIFFTWFLLFLTLPVALFVTATVTFAVGLERLELTGKILLGVAGHIIITIVTFAFLILLIIGAEPRHNLEFSTGEQLVGLFAVFIYGVAGWLLCSFINGKLIKSWTYFSLNSGKPPSILDVR